MDVLKVFLGGANLDCCSNRLMYSVVFNWNITDRWEYVIQHDLGWDDFDGANPDNEWYGINQYLFYQLNRCWRFGARFEWFRDDDGSRLSAAPLRASAA